jgi:hypothetical protein
LCFNNKTSAFSWNFEYLSTGTEKQSKRKEAIYQNKTNLDIVADKYIPGNPNLKEGGGVTWACDRR